MYIIYINCDIVNIHFLHLVKYVHVYNYTILTAFASIVWKNQMPNGFYMKLENFMFIVDLSYKVVPISNMARSVLDCLIMSGA